MEPIVTRVTLSHEGSRSLRVVIPSKVSDKMGIQEHDYVEWADIQKGKVMLIKRQLK